MSSACLFLLSMICWAPQGTDREALAIYVRQNYAKFEHHIPMRDGVKLFTAVYIPNDRSKTYPIMMVRSAFSVAPYGPDKYRTALGPTAAFDYGGYIFVYQDVRGINMSEGDFENVRANRPAKARPKDTNESTDT